MNYPFVYRFYYLIRKIVTFSNYYTVLVTNVLLHLTFVDDLSKWSCASCHYILFYRSCTKWRSVITMTRPSCWRAGVPSNIWIAKNLYAKCLGGAQTFDCSYLIGWQHQLLSAGQAKCVTSNLSHRRWQLSQQGHL